MLMHVCVWIFSKTRDGLLQMLNTSFQHQNLVDKKELAEESLKRKIIDDKDIVHRY